MKAVFLRFSLALLLLTAVVDARLVSAATSATKKTAAPVTAVSDTQIQQKIQTKLSKSKIGKDGFRFHVSHGVVTWEGTTDVVQHKGSATRMARTAGASQVVNNIQVSASAKAKAARQLHGSTAAALQKATVKED